MEADEEVVGMKPLDVKGAEGGVVGVPEGSEPPDPRLKELLGRLDTAVIFPEDPQPRSSDNGE